MLFNKKWKLLHDNQQQGQAVVEMCVCIIAVLVVFLGLIFVGGLGLSNIRHLIKAKTNAETNSKPNDNTGDSEEMFSWDYRNQQRQQRQTFESDAFQGSHLFSPNRTGNINGLPSAGNDRIINNKTNSVNANQNSTLFQDDFQSTFLRELIPASQLKRSDSAANSAFRNIPPLFVGAEETAGNQEADETVSVPGKNSSDGQEKNVLPNTDKKDVSGTAQESQDNQNSATLLKNQPDSKNVKKKR